jgi:hypothetical protein
MNRSQALEETGGANTTGDYGYHTVRVAVSGCGL